LVLHHTYSPPTPLFISVARLAYWIRKEITNIMWNSDGSESCADVEGQRTMFNPAFLAWQNSSANLIEPVGPPFLVFLLGVETMPSARHGCRRQLNEKMMTTDLALLQSTQ
jgi:hypothetical protein